MIFKLKKALVKGIHFHFMEIEMKILRYVFIKNTYK